MAASSSCNSIGAAIDKLGRFVHQGAPNSTEGSLHISLLNVDFMKGIKGTDDHLISISPIVPNNQASRQSMCRFASIAIVATACAGLSMCPVEALAMAYDGDHRNVGESVFNTSTSMLQLSGSRDQLDMMSKFYDENGMHILNAEMEATVGNVPSVKPPNEGLNSPWVPKINGLKKKDANRRASMRCPKWTESELEMVLPDFQGRPKPFPRMQGRLYPFWPATASANINGDDDDDDGKGANLIQNKSKQSIDEAILVIKLASSTQNDGAHDTTDRKMLPSSPAPPPQQHHMPSKKPSCFTM